MKTLSGKVISTKPVSLSDAAAILSDFASTETGASDAVSVYIRRAADAFNQLVQFHNDMRPSNSGSKRLPVKVEQFPEEKYRKNDKIRDLDVKNEALVKTEPHSVATEENRKKKNYGAEKVKKEKSEKGLNGGEEDRVGVSGSGKYRENKFEKVKTESTLKNEPELDVVEGDSMKKKDKKKKKKNKQLSEGNEGEEGETLVVETKKRKSEDIDVSDEQSSRRKKKSKKQRVESK